MKFEIANKPLLASRSHNGRKHFAMPAWTSVVCVLLIIVYVRHKSVNREDKGPGFEPGLNGSDTGKGGAPRAGGQPGEPGLPGTTGPEGKTETSGAAGPVDGLGTSTESIQNLTASGGIVEGIIAGTYKGVVIIPLDTMEQRKVSSEITWGVAFNWQSRKVYWIVDKVGIKMAELDGVHPQLLISDPDLCGLDVDHITGNLYFGVQGSNPGIRVCDSMGKKCVTVVLGVNHVGEWVYDIALFPSEGLMFWSSPVDKQSVTRANMDGKNATVIILEEIFGLYSDEFTEKLYWANPDVKSFGHRDLNGCNRNVVLNTTISPNDIAVDGDTLYFGGWRPNGVYSVTSNRQVSSIANTSVEVLHIALFGINKVSSRANPCKNSPCSNLCVLNRVSYTCL